MAREEKFPLGIASLFASFVQLNWKMVYSAGGGESAAVFADNANHSVTIADVVGECAKQRLALGALLEIALNRNLVTTGAQIAGKGIAGLAELARDCGYEDAQALLRHGSVQTAQSVSRDGTSLPLVGRGRGGGRKARRRHRRCRVTSRPPPPNSPHKGGGSGQNRSKYSLCSQAVTSPPSRRRLPR